MSCTKQLSPIKFILNLDNNDKFMPRSTWKNPFSENQIFKDSHSNLDNKKPIKLLNRHTIIFPAFIGKTFSVHNGKNFVNVQISEKMVGYKFGEFVITRKKAIHKKK